MFLLRNKKISLNYRQYPLLSGALIIIKYCLAGALNLYYDTALSKLIYGKIVINILITMASTWVEMDNSHNYNNHLVLKLLEFNINVLHFIVCCI